MKQAKGRQTKTHTHTTTTTTDKQTKTNDVLMMALMMFVFSFADPSIPSRTSVSPFHWLDTHEADQKKLTHLYNKTMCHRKGGHLVTPQVCYRSAAVLGVHKHLFHALGQLLLCRGIGDASRTYSVLLLIFSSAAPSFPNQTLVSP